MLKKLKGAPILGHEEDVAELVGPWLEQYPELAQEISDTIKVRLESEMKYLEKNLGIGKKGLSASDGPLGIPMVRVRKDALEKFREDIDGPFVHYKFKGRRHRAVAEPYVDEYRAMKEARRTGENLEAIEEWEALLKDLDYEGTFERTEKQRKEAGGLEALDIDPGRLSSEDADFLMDAEGNAVPTAFADHPRAIQRRLMMQGVSQEEAEKLAYPPAKSRTGKADYEKERPGERGMEVAAGMALTGTFLGMGRAHGKDIEREQMYRAEIGEEGTAEVVGHLIPWVISSGPRLVLAGAKKVVGGTVKKVSEFFVKKGMVREAIKKSGNIRGGAKALDPKNVAAINEATRFTVEQTMKKFLPKTLTHVA